MSYLKSRIDRLNRKRPKPPKNVFVIFPDDLILSMPHVFKNPSDDEIENAGPDDVLLKVRWDDDDIIIDVFEAQ